MSDAETLDLTQFGLLIELLGVPDAGVLSAEGDSLAVGLDAQRWTRGELTHSGVDLIGTPLGGWAGCGETIAMILFAWDF